MSLLSYSPVEDIISTKLSAPLIKDTMIFRPRLDEQFCHSRENRIILVTAPAGYGKSTAVAQWLMQQDYANFSWLSLDEGDNDPVRFWRYIIHSLSRFHPGIGEQSLEAIQGPGINQEKALTILINEIGRVEEEHTLVLDDYHLIKDEILQRSITFFFNHSPAQLRFCLIGRETPSLPLSLYRSRGLLFELTRKELAFTDQETELFFNRCSNLTVPQETLGQLNSYMEGWIAGLYMLSLALRSNSVESILNYKDLSKELFFADYIVGEILEKQPTVIGRFLLFTSIVDQFSASLGEELSGEKSGQEILERASRAQLFLLPVDRERRWYRCHPLFRDLLKEELEKRYPDSVPGLYLRAGRWFAGEGQFSKAITYLLKAKAYSEVGALIEKHAPIFFQTGQIKTLVKWIGSCPEQTFRERPSLRLYRIWGNIFLGKLAAVADQVDVLESDLQGENPGVTLSSEVREGLQDDLLVTKSFISFILGKPEAPREYLALSKNFTGKGFLLRQIIPFNIHASALQGDAGMRGHLRKAAHFYEQTAPEIEKLARQFPTYAIGYTIVAEIACETGHLKKALHYIKTALRVCEQAEEPGILVPAYLAYARIKMIQGEYQAALEMVRSTAQHEWVSGSPQWSSILDAQLVRFALRIPNLLHNPIVDEWLARRGLKPGDQISPLQEFEYITLLRVLLTKGLLEEGLNLSERMLPVVELEGSIGALIELYLLQALGWSTLKQPVKSRTALERALTLAEEHGYYRLLLDEGTPLLTLLRQFYQKQMQLLGESGSESKLLQYTRRLIDGLSEQNAAGEPAEPPEAQEPLTRREKEILALLAAGRSNLEISEGLFISPTTVKTHLRNIYRKLGVSNRLQAVTRAKLLNVLPGAE